jgi:hypothetical protein
VGTGAKKSLRGLGDLPANAAKDLARQKCANRRMYNAKAKCNFVKDLAKARAELCAGGELKFCSKKVRAEKAVAECHENNRRRQSGGLSPKPCPTVKQASKSPAKAKAAAGGNVVHATSKKSCEETNTMRRSAGLKAKPCPKKGGKKRKAAKGKRKAGKKTHKRTAHRRKHAPKRKHILLVFASRKRATGPKGKLKAGCKRSGKGKKMRFRCPRKGTKKSKK